MGLIIEYPLWFIILCILFGAAVSAALYYRNSFDEFPGWLTLSLSIVRFIAVTIISFLLLSPFLKFVTSDIEKPRVLVFQDNSRSMLNYSDSSYLVDEYAISFEQFEAGLRSDFEIEKFTFGDELKKEGELSFSELSTDFSEVTSEINGRYTDRNISAVVLVTDGNYNKGVNPEYAISDFAIPIVTIAIGDTLVQQDAWITKVLHSQIAYKNSEVPLEVVLRLSNIESEDILLNIYHKGQIIKSEKVKNETGKNTYVIETSVKVKETGKQLFRIEVEPLANEVSLTNNISNIFIDVIESRSRILLLHHSPHPDITALREVVESNIDFAIDIQNLNSFSGSIENYNLLVLHQLPAINNRIRGILNQCNEKEIPVFFMMGPKNSIGQLNSMQSCIVLYSDGETYQDVTPQVNHSFNLFKLNDSQIQLIRRFTPLNTRNVVVNYVCESDVLMNQQIRGIDMEQPLLLFSGDGGQKLAYLLGEGIWRWRMYNYLQQGNHDVFNTLFSKILQYLVLKEDKGRFRIMLEDAFLQNQDIEIRAELYNESFEKDNEARVEIEIENERNERFPYTFGLRDSAYYLNIGKLEEGVYSYRASVQQSSEELFATGQFVVRSQNLELQNTNGNHHILYKIANTSEGIFLTSKELNKAKEFIQELDSRPRIHYVTSYQEVIHWKLLLFVIILLLSIEWLVRKLSGSY